MLMSCPRAEIGGGGLVHRFRGSHFQLNLLLYLEVSFDMAH